MLINNNQLSATHDEISKKKSINRIFDNFCLLVFSYHKDIENNADKSSEEIHKSLEQFLKKNVLGPMNTVPRTKSFIEEDLGEALYAMCALADELFLSVKWGGRSFWEKHLLESAFFNTHVSGEEIFRRIDILLEEGNAVYADLGEMYLKMLALGFSGKYIGVDSNNEITQYRDKLYLYITSSDYTAVIKNDKLFNEEYVNTMISANKSLLPDPHVWNRAIAAYLACFLIIGIIIWNFNVSDIFDDISEIEEIVLQGAD